jgi:hypothetical protein
MHNDVRYFRVGDDLFVSSKHGPPQTPQLWYRWVEEGGGWTALGAQTPPEIGDLD